jgi:hypothetical protein
VVRLDGGSRDTPARRLLGAACRMICPGASGTVPPGSLPGSPGAVPQGSLPIRSLPREVVDNHGPGVDALEVLTMTIRTQVLEDVRGYGAARRVRLTTRAREQMSKLGFTADDVRYGLMQATAGKEGDARFHVETITRDVVRLSLIVFFADAYLVIVEVSP